MVHVPGVQAQRSPRRPVASTRPSWSRSMSASTRRWRWCATSVASCWPPVGVPGDAGWGAAAGRPGPGSHPWTDGLAGPGRGGGGRAGPSAVDEHRCPARRLAADPDQPGPGGRQRRLRGRRRLKTDALDLAANSDLLGPGTALVVVSWPRRRGVGWVGGPRAAGHGPDRAQEPAPGPGRPGLPGVSGGVWSLFGTRSAGWCWPGSTDPARRSALGWLAASRLPPPGGPGPGPGGRAAGGRRHRGRPDRPGLDGPDHHRPRPHLLAAFDAQIAEADKRLAALLPRTRFAVLSSGLAGGGPRCHRWCRGR